MKKKKIGILTFHNAVNVGAMLQAYALEKSVNKLGYDCEIIDFRTGDNDFVDIKGIRELILEYGILIGSLKCINHFRIGYYNKKNKRVKFFWFMKNNMRLSRRIYRKDDELAEASYDAILFGSDQIWNENLLDDIHLSYFGSFFNDNIKRIAYAASNGRGFIPKNIMEYVYPLLKKFYKISVREYGLAEFLEKEYELDAQLVADPTLLVSATEWKTLKVKQPKILNNQKYIFVYTFDEPDVYEYARKLSKKYDMPIVNYRWCGPHKRFNDMIQLCDGGPREFLTLLDNAEIVCTSSFHGTVYSILFHKPMVCVLDKSYGERIRNLLTLMKMDKNIVEYNNSVLYNNIFHDYYETDRYINDARNASISFLKEALT